MGKWQIMILYVAIIGHFTKCTVIDSSPYDKRDRSARNSHHGIEGFTQVTSLAHRM